MTGTIGIIGAGSIVEQYYFSTLRQLGYSSICIFDTNFERARHVSEQFKVKQVPLEYIKRSADIIIIATPPHTHYELVKELIAPHQIIICEKPFVLTLAQAQQLQSQSLKQGCRLLIAHLRRTFPGIQAAQQFIINNHFNLGKLELVQIAEGSRFSYHAQSGYVHNNKWGGVLADTGSHVLDSLLYVTGLENEPITCEVMQMERDQEEPAHEIHSCFTLNNIKVDLRLSRYEALSNKITLHYEHAQIDIPLGTKPNFRVTSADSTQIYSAADSCVTYYSEAFKEELRLMLQHPEDNRFDVSRFINLSYVLETLYNA